MNETLVHRGPDSGGAFVNGRVGLAARRLAIIDLAGGDQPIANEDGSIVVVQNGENYNYRELMHELERPRPAAWPRWPPGPRASPASCPRATATASSRSTIAPPATSSRSPRSSTPSP